MPLYDFECPSCGRKDFDIIAKAEEHTRDCRCGAEQNRLLPTWSINPDVEPYLDENLGHEPVYVKSRRHLREELKTRRLVQIG